ncbi:Desmethyl-deoxy-podophyllotoxin synthase [Linum grandiflorum]
MLIPILGLTLLLIVLFRKKQKASATAPAPPGPWKLPVIGNLHQLMMSPRGTHHRLRELALKHGPVMQLQFGEVTNVIISSPEAAKQVMKTHDLVFASRPSSMLAPSIIFYGCQDVAFAPYGEHWRQMRKICIVELLSAKRVSLFRSIREHEVSNLVAHLNSQAGETEGVDMRRLFASLTSNVTSKAAFGAMEKAREAFVGLVDKIIETHEGFGVSDLFPSLKFLPVVTGFRRKLESIHRAADSILEEIINQHRDKRRRSDDDQYTEDIVDILLNLQETGDLPLPLTDDVIKAVVFDMFIGGIETSSSTIEWTMSEIVKNPRVLELAQQEVRRVFGTKGKVDEDGLHELNYLNAVLKESLRMHPNGPLALPRESRATVTVNGYEVPAKTRVLVHLWAIGRDPHYWVDPDVFQPERFLDSSIDYKGTHFEFIPFGAGRRICPGMLFGLAIVQLTLANLLFHFDWKPPVGMDKLEDLDMTEHFGISLTKNEILRLVPVSPAR